MAQDDLIVSPSVGIYTRISPREKGDESLSLQNQEIRSRERAANAPGVVSPSFTLYCDEHLSGKLPFQKPGVKRFRPALTRLVRDIESGKLHIVVVYRFDRLTRNAWLWAELVVICRDHKVRLLSACEPLDVNTIEGKMTAGMLAQVSEFYIDWTGQNIRDVLRQKKQQGYRAGNPPYGWRWSQERVDGHRLVERDDGEGKVVLDICEKVRSGWNFARLCKYLGSQGVKSPSGNDRWHPSMVRRVAKDPFNAGLVTLEDKSRQTGKHWELRYFDPEYHDQVVAELRRRAPVAPVTRWSETHLLMPKLRCANCGTRLYVDKRSDNRNRVYWCKNKSAAKGHACIGARAMIAWADAAVVRVIRGLSQDDRIIAKAESVIEAELGHNTAKLKQEKAKIERDVREDKQRLALMVEKLADGQIESYAYTAFQDRVKERTEQRLARLQEVETALRSGDANQERIQEVKNTLRDFNEIWENLTIDEQRKVIDLLIEDLQLSQTHMVIKPHFAEAVEVRIPAGRFRDGETGEARGLSQRERAVLKLLGEGLSPKQIAERAGLALQTVYCCTSAIYSWLGVDDIASAIEMARPIIDEADDLPTDRRLGRSTHQVSDEPTAKMLTVLRAVAAHPTQAEAYRSLGMPYINGSQRLRALMKKTGTGSLNELFQTAVEKGWIGCVPERKETGLTFTESEAEMMRACIGAKSIAAAGRSIGLSSAAAASRVHTVYVKLGVHNLEEAVARLRELGLDPGNLCASQL